MGHEHSRLAALGLRPRRTLDPFEHRSTSTALIKLDCVTIQGIAPVLAPLRPSNEVIDDPSKLASLLVREGGLLDLPLRAAFSPAHPLARRDVPLARARAFQFFLPLFRGSGQGCPQLRATFSPAHPGALRRALDPCEHILIVRVPRAEGRPGSPLLLTELRTSVRRRSLSVSCAARCLTANLEHRLSNRLLCSRRDGQEKQTPPNPAEGAQDLWCFL